MAKTKIASVKYKGELVDSKTILSVRHLKQFFNLESDYKTKAVHDISFDVKEGECFGLVGESGCGKTTTGRSIINLYNITSGSVYYKGYRISGGSRWNEKEIKWTKVRGREKIRHLKGELRSALAAKNGKPRDYDRAIEKFEKAIAHEETKGEFKDEAIIKALRKAIARLGTERDNVQPLLSLSEEEIRSRYEKEIALTKEHVSSVVKEQKAKIRQIRYDNKHRDRALTSEIQMIFQDPIDSLDPRMTVEDIIQEGLKIQKREITLKTTRNAWKC